MELVALAGAEGVGPLLHRVLCSRSDVDVPAVAVRAIDTVGAGDAFNGALAAGLAAGLDLETAARRAVAAAAVSTTHAGAREGMPTIAELEGFLDAG